MWLILKILKMTFDLPFAQYVTYFKKYMYIVYIILFANSLSEIASFIFIYIYIVIIILVHILLVLLHTQIEQTSSTRQQTLCMYNKYCKYRVTYSIVNVKSCFKDLFHYFQLLILFYFTTHNKKIFFYVRNWLFITENVCFNSSKENKHISYYNILITHKIKKAFNITLQRKNILPIIK